MKTLIFAVLFLLSSLANAAVCSNLNSLVGVYVIKFTNVKLPGMSGVMNFDNTTVAVFSKSTTATTYGAITGGKSYESNKFYSVTTTGSSYTTNDALCRVTLYLTKTYTDFNPDLVVKNIRVQLEADNVADNGTIRVIQHATGTCRVLYDAANQPYTFGTNQEMSCNAELTRVE